jgi:hypothetical protein
MRRALLLLAGCGRIGFDGASGAAGGGAGGDPASGVDAMPVAVASTISGTGCPSMPMPFSRVMAAYAIGNPQYATAPEIILFDQPITCAQISGRTSWDDSSRSTLPPSTQFLRLMVEGGSPATYSLVNSDPLASGSVTAKATYYQTQPQPAMAVRCDSLSGSVVVTSGGPGALVTGQFSISLEGGSALTGTFDTTSCPTGWYP